MLKRFVFVGAADPEPVLELRQRGVAGHRGLHDCPLHRGVSQNVIHKECARIAGFRRGNGLRRCGRESPAGTKGTRDRPGEEIWRWAYSSIFSSLIAFESSTFPPIRFVA
ncbi:hypothetical protein GCM10009076_09600 [Erythrobacter ramosus]